MYLSDAVCLIKNSINNTLTVDACKSVHFSLTQQIKNLSRYIE